VFDFSARVSGHRTQIPHVQWTDKVIARGDNVPVAMTGVVKRYAGPPFRTFGVGPSPKMAADFEVVQDQLEAACDFGFFNVPSVL